MTATYYAQNREDMILQTLLWGTKKGFYVDVGANHPRVHSVTRYFYEQGWKGINIEPIPSLHKLLAKDRKRDLNLNCGASNRKGTLYFREYTGIRHGLSTFSQAMQEKIEGPYKEYEVSVLPLKRIFEDAGVKHIDFLKVDVEGHETEVLESNDWDKYRPSVVVVENTPGKWVSLLRNNGYKQVFFDGLNRYFVPADRLQEHTMKNFHYVLTGDYQTALEAELKQSLSKQGAKLQYMYELHAELVRRLEALRRNPAKIYAEGAFNKAKKVTSRITGK